MYVSRGAELANAISEWRKPEFSGAQAGNYVSRRAPVEEGQNGSLKIFSPRTAMITCPNRWILREAEGGGESHLSNTCRIWLAFVRFRAYPFVTGFEGRIAPCAFIDAISKVILSAHPAGIEPATIGLEDRCSIH